MSFEPDPLGVANTLAARATTAYLIGRGLAVEIEDSRFPDDGDPIPAPHVEELIAELGAATSDACNAGDLVAQLLNDPDDEALNDSLDAALAETLRASEAAQRANRTLAQLMLGVTSQLGWNDEIARAERAATMVLHPAEERVVPLTEDGLMLRARHDPELVTELCGAFCRMIIDHNCELEIRTDAAGERRWIVARVDAVGNLDLSTVVAPAEVDELLDLGIDLDVALAVGWNRVPENDGGLHAAWDDPLSVLEPARLVLATLQRFVTGPLADDLVATVRPSTDDR